MNPEKLKAMLRANSLFLKERSGKIGYGHDLNRNPLPTAWTVPITFEQAEALLGMDARRIDEECEQRLSMWDKRDEARQLATAMLVYALGIDAVAGMQDFNRCLRDGAWETAALNLEASDFARERPEIAARVATMIRTGMER